MTTTPCTRCGQPAECADVGLLYRNGRTYDPVFLCLDCAELQYDDHRTFWDEGWKGCQADADKK